jgi:hypothetical protein
VLHTNQLPNWLTRRSVAAIRLAHRMDPEQVWEIATMSVPDLVRQLT